MRRLDQPRVNATEVPPRPADGQRRTGWGWHHHGLPVKEDLDRTASGSVVAWLIHTERSGVRAPADIQPIAGDEHTERGLQIIPGMFFGTVAILLPRLHE